MTPIRPSRPVYGTTLRCSCGQRFGRTVWRNIGAGEDIIRYTNRVSNSAPTKGGRTDAQAAYQRHVDEALGIPES